MLTQNDIKVIEFFLKHTQDEFSIREISRQIKTDYKLAHNSIKRLINKKIIAKKRHGKTELCIINLKDAADYLIQVENIKSRRFLERNTGIKLTIREIKEKIKNPYYTFILFGSYAKEKQHKRSDLDLLVIVPGEEFIKEIEAAINSVSAIKPIKIHSLVVTSKDFMEMLTAKDGINIAKETLNNHIIFYGAEAYYNLLEVL